jgi:hypothetical protein
MKDHVIGYANEVPDDMKWGILIVEGDAKGNFGKFLHLCCYPTEPTAEDIKHLTIELITDEEFADVASEIKNGNYKAYIIAPHQLPSLLEQLQVPQEKESS